MDRRQFFISVLRTGAAIGTISLGAYIMSKNTGDKKSCETFNACRNCSSLSDCDKQQAKDYINKDAER